jgi:hypothetical protein
MIAPDRVVDDGAHPTNASTTASTAMVLIIILIKTNSVRGVLRPQVGGS